MFGGHNVLKDGAQTDGVILERHSSHKLTESRVVIAVKFDDGETAQFEEVMVNYYEPPSHGLKDLAGNLTGENAIPMSFIPGEKIPVRYDPSDRKRIAVDVPAFNERTLEQWTAKENANRERALAALDSPAHSGATPLDPELQALMDMEEAERK
jgi:hypothetical protein